MNHVRIAALAATIGLSGCATWGDFVAPPHESSAWAGTDATCIVVNHVAGEESILATAGIKAGEAVLEWAYDALLAAGKAEAGRYSASYSGRTTAPVYLKDGTRPIPPTKLTLYRYAPRPEGLNAATCGSKSKPALSVSFLVESKAQAAPVVAKGAAAEPAATATPLLSYRLVPQQVILRKAKAKVPTVSAWRPWTWALLLEKELALVDLNVKVGLSATVIDSTGARAKKEIAVIDFPIGKLALPDEGSESAILPDVKNASALEALASDWFELPAPSQLPVSTCAKEAVGKGCVAGNWGTLTVDVTVDESNDLGDVLKKEVDRASEKRDERIKKLVDKLEAELEDQE